LIVARLLGHESFYISFFIFWRLNHAKHLYRSGGALNHAEGNLKNNPF